MTTAETYTFAPIGFFHGAAMRKYDAPRQGVFNGGSGQVLLEGHRNFEMALRDLAGFERIWLLFVFNRNGREWRPTTRPPVIVPGHERVGVFASRAPYRPNAIGMSCVRLLSVTGLALDVAECDLLDGTPILDIKPYVPTADAFPNAAAGWVDAQDTEAWQVVPSAEFCLQAARLMAVGAPDLVRVARLQLAHNPFDAACKRVIRRGAGLHKGTLSVRMFRLDFEVDAAAHIVHVTTLRSGYTAAELASNDDPYDDKAFHRVLVAQGPTA